MTVGPQCSCGECVRSRACIIEGERAMAKSPHLAPVLADTLKSYKRQLATHQKRMDKEAQYVRYTENKRGTSPFYERHKLYDEE